VAELVLDLAEGRTALEVAEQAVQASVVAEVPAREREAAAAEEELAPGLVEVGAEQGVVQSPGNG
jgi:hypothetical protein